MQINIYYEKKSIEFNGKLYLAAKLIQNKDINEVNLGFYKPMIFKFLSELDSKKKIINLFKDYWRNTEIFADLAKLFGQKYFVNHEEDYLVFHKEIIQDAAKLRFMSKYYFKNLDGIFCISDDIKNEYVNNLKLDSEKYQITGDLRYSFLNLVKSKGHFEGKFHQKSTLISLHSPIFRSKFRYMKRIKFDPKKLQDQQYTGYSILDEQLMYDYTKEYLRLAIKVIKRNPKINFLFRPYPSENEYVRYYKKIFKKYKNVKIDLDNDIFYCLSNCYQTFCPSDNVSLESVMMGNSTYVYCDFNNDIHRYIFKDHPFLNLFKKNIFKNETEFNNLLSTEKNIELDSQIRLKKMYGLDNDAFSIIPEIFDKCKNNFVNNANKLTEFKKKLVIYAIRKILRSIKLDIVKDNYSTTGYNNFKKKFKFSFSRLILFFIFNNTSSRLDLSNIIYKYCIGRNFVDHTVVENKGYLYNMNIDEIERFFEFYKINFEKNIKLKLNKENNILTFYKTK
jgi:hypothetical protein